MAEQGVQLKQYLSSAEYQWCPGCKNFALLGALKKSLVSLGKRPEDICLVSGIGQAAKLPHYLRCNFFNGLHGRALPVAVGVKAANSELTTIVTTGDGDCYGEGGNHFVHTIRRNLDITLIVHNNQIYGLTKGQGSPTTDYGDRTRLQVQGVTNHSFQPLSTALINGATFVARGYTGDMDGLADIFSRAISHKGFSYVDVIQPCIIWGTHDPHWYEQRLYALDQDHDATDKQAALVRSLEWGDKIPFGVFYQVQGTPVFGERFVKAVGNPIALQPTARETIEALIGS